MLTIKYDGNPLNGNKQAKPANPASQVRLYDLLDLPRHTREERFTRTKLPTHYIHFEKRRNPEVEDIFSAILSGIRTGDFNGFREGHIVMNGSGVSFEDVININPTDYLKKHPTAFDDETGAPVFRFYEGSSLDAALALFEYSTRERSAPPRLELVEIGGAFDLERARELIKPVVVEEKRDEIAGMIEKSG